MPTPWRTGPFTETRRLRIVDAHNQIVGVVGHRADDYGVSDGERIVACVNACDGIDDPAAALAQVRALLQEFDGHVSDGRNARHGEGNWTPKAWHARMRRAITLLGG